MGGMSSSARSRIRPEQGLIRVALAAVVLLCLIRWWDFQGAPGAYLAAVFAAALGLLLIARPKVAVRWGLACVVADAVGLGVLLAETGGGGSPFFPLYFPAALSVAHLAGRGRGSARLPTAAVVAAAALIGGYLIAALLVGGPGSPRFVLNAVVLLLFCAAALYLGLKAHEARERAEKADGVAALERDRRERAHGLTRVFGPTLGSLSVESALGVIAEAAREISGGSYAHVAALRGNLHRTVMVGESDACPSWWHPSVQRLLLWSCREGKTVRRGETVHGVEGFVAVPVGSPDRERWGAIIVGGGRVGGQEEHALLELAAAALPALARRPDAKGGLDLPSGLPNAVSLSRALREELSLGGTPGVLAIDLCAEESDTDENLLNRLGKRLQGAGQRAFRYDESTLIVLVEDTGQAAVAGKAGVLRQMLRDEASAPEKAIAASAVGFALGRSQGGGPEGLLGAAFGALEEARVRKERIAGTTDPPRTTALALDAEMLDARAPYVRCLVQAMAARDPYLSVHSEEVSRVAWRIGRVLSLPEGQLDALKIGALLHDVGKIGIPDRILHKPGRLTEEEYAVVKRHPGLGAKILSALPELAPVLPSVRHHHERFDGLGYPDGLRGEEISILARVVCVADAYDTLTRERPYGRPVSAEVALAEIQRNAGSQFDPRVAEALSQSAAGPDNPLADFAV